MSPPKVPALSQINRGGVARRGSSRRTRLTEGDSLGGDGPPELALPNGRLEPCSGNANTSRTANARVHSSFGASAMTLERPASLKFDARQVLGGFGGIYLVNAIVGFVFAASMTSQRSMSNS